MKNILILFRREWGAYFNSTIAYIFLIVFSLVTSSLYLLSFFLAGRIEMRSFFSGLPIMLVVFIPAITMRLWAEERKEGTFELLLTLPLKTRDLVLGKFFASLAFYAIALGTTASIPLMLKLLGKPDWGPILGGYFGSFLCGSFFIGLGLFVSGLCKDQILAFVVSMMTCLSFYLLGMPLVALQLDGWTGTLALGTRILKFVAMTPHFEGVERGLLDARDVIYFLSMTALFLGLNVFYLESRMKPHAKRQLIVYTFVYTCLILFFNGVADGFTRERFDLTEEKIYTVSPEAKGVLSQLKVPVKVDFYISPPEKMPSLMKTFEEEVVDKIQEFEIASNGNLQFQVHHVEAMDALNIQRREMRKLFSKRLGEDAAKQLLGEAEKAEETESQKLSEELMKKGVVPFQVQSIEADERTIVSIYSGMTLAYKEKKPEAIPRLTPQNFGSLEYELISRIFHLTRDPKPRIALITPKDRMDPQIKELFEARGIATAEEKDHFKYLPKILESEEYEIIPIDFEKNESIPENVNTVVIVNPQRWNKREIWELNHALLSGKSVILAIQSYQQNYTSDQEGPHASSLKINTGLDGLLKKYGVQVSSDFLMDRQSETLSIQTEERYGPFEVAMPIHLPTHVILTGDSMNPDISISNRLSSLFYLWGTVLIPDTEKILKNHLKTTTLLSSGKESWTHPFREGELKREDIEPPDHFEPGKPLALLIEGTFPDAFKDKKKPRWEKGVEEKSASAPQDEKTSPPSIAQPARLFMVACAMIWNDHVIEYGNNGDFFINSVDALTLGDELIHLRTKEKMARLIPKLSGNQKMLYRFLGTGIIPLFLILLGVGRLSLRRFKRERYLRRNFS
ncbi:MAG: Gldg family protein [Chlamydiae bacterium]|nr:Gldg family protein [Chlamydiota bacterium]MBI3267237.1 Gldg family protein [Chlamydiota bacterium]